MPPTSSFFIVSFRVVISSNIDSGLLQNKEDLPPVLSREGISFVEYLANTHYMYTPVLHMIHLTKGRGCKDERDRVYGLLGLFPPEFQKRIHPDYGLTTSRVYIDLVVSCIQIEGSLALLRRCQLTRRLAGKDLPSWVPDLSDIDSWTGPLEWLHAAGDSRAEFAILEPGLLQVTGLQYATVSSAESPPFQGNSEERARKIFDLLELAGQYIKSEHIQSGAISNLDAFAKTLVGGFLRDRFPDEVLSSLEQWRIQVASQSFMSGLLQGLKDKNVLSFQEKWAASLLEGRIFFRTHEGHVGLGPAGTQSGLPYFHTTFGNR